MGGETGAESNRRRFLEWIIRGSAFIIGAVTVVPGVGMILAPILSSSGRKRRKVLLQNTADAESASFVAARFEGQEETAPGLFIRKAAGGQVQVLSAKCTHAGCAITWQADKNEFFCPCHAGRFDQNGKVLSGPPPRPLDRVNAQVVNGEIFIEEPEA